MIRNNVNRIKELMENPIARDMIEHCHEISGYLTEGWIKCNI